MHQPTRMRQDGPPPARHSIRFAKQRAAATAVLLCYLRRQLQAIALRPRSRRGLLRNLTAVVLGALALTGAVLAMPAHPARSQGARTIRVVISVPPGGSIDLLVRILADHISTAKGQSIIVESRPGAGAIIAAHAVAPPPPAATPFPIT